MSYERHIEGLLINEADAIGLIACDKELGRYEKYPGLSATAVSVVARNLGIPFCQYSRRPGNTKREIDRFQSLRRWDSEDITLSGNGSEEWGAEIAELWGGFHRIHTEYQKPHTKKLKPAAALAAIMERPNAATRISLYGSGDQSVLAEILPFIDEKNPTGTARRMARVLGRWLVLSILRFPGLLLNTIAAASYLNIAEADFARNDIQSHFADAKYSGPFCGLDDWWWRDDLETQILEEEASDGRSLLMARNIAVDACLDASTGTQAGCYCMITQLPVSRENSKGNINWFPSGADLARIRNDEFERITSLVSM